MPILNLLICRPQSVAVGLPCNVSPLRDSSLYRVEEHICMNTGHGDRVLARKGWILRPVHRGYCDEPAYAVHPNLCNAMRAVANAIADVQSGFVQRLGRNARFQLLFGATYSEGQILEKLGKSRAALARQTRILNAMDDWLQALWEERETALAAVRAVYESAIALHDHHEQWENVKGLWKRYLPDLACAPFDAFANAVRAEMTASGQEPVPEDTRRMAEALSAEANAMLRSQALEDADIHLSRVKSCLRRAPMRRREEALTHLIGAKVLLEVFWQKYRGHLKTQKERAAFHGGRWRLEIVKRAVQRQCFPKAIGHLEFSRERLATLMDRAY